MQADLPALNLNPAFKTQWRNLDVRANLAVLASMGLITVILALLVNSPVLWALVALSVVGVIFVEPRLGLYLTIVLVMFDVASYDPLTAPFWVLYYRVSFSPLTPIEIVILLTFASWAGSALRSRQIGLPDGALSFHVLGFSALVAIGCLIGISKGGAIEKAWFEVRTLFLILPLVFTFCGLIRTRHDIVNLAIITTVSLAVLSVELLWRYIALLRPTEAADITDSFTHEGAMLVSMLAVFAFASMVWRRELKPRSLSFVLFVLAMLVLLVSRRRAALVGAQAGFLVLIVVLGITNWRRFASIAPLALVIATLYVGAFWNNENALGQPVRGIKSVLSLTSQSERDQSSDTYRIVEKYNIWFNIQNSPATGLGFGNTYPKPYPLINLSDGWPLWDYIPHNQILWLWMKGGALLFLSFWLLLGTSLARGISLVRGLRDTFLLSTVAVSCAVLVMVFLFAYVDLALTSPRVIVYFTMSMALISAVGRIHGETSIEAGRQPAETGGQAHQAPPIVGRSKVPVTHQW